MHCTGKDNPEYMAALAEVVDCLCRQLHDPRLSKCTATEVHRWLTGIKLEEVELALTRIDHGSRRAG